MAILSHHINRLDTVAVTGRSKQGNICIKAHSRLKDTLRILVRIRVLGLDRKSTRLNSSH